MTVVVCTVMLSWTCTHLSLIPYNNKNNKKHNNKHNNKHNAILAQEPFLVLTCTGVFPFTSASGFCLVQVSTTQFR